MRKIWGLHDHVLLNSICYFILYAFLILNFFLCFILFVSVSLDLFHIFLFAHGCGGVGAMYGCPICETT